MQDNIQAYFPKAVGITISLNRTDIRNYVVMRLERDDEPEAMNNHLRAGVVGKIILDKVFNMYVDVSPLARCILTASSLDSSSFR